MSYHNTIVAFASAIWQALGRVASLLEASLDDVHNF